MTYEVIKGHGSVPMTEVVEAVVVLTPSEDPPPPLAKMAPCVELPPVELPPPDVEPPPLLVEVAVDVETPLLP
jgi:hypothetical protein